MKRLWLAGIAGFLLTLPLAAFGASIPAGVFENGPGNNPVSVSGAKVEVYGGYAFKVRLSAGESGTNGEVVLKNVPLGRDVLVKLTKPGYIAQYDVKSYGESDVENGVTLWIGSEANVSGIFTNLGETFDPLKGHIYLEINNELTGEGIEGLQMVSSSGKIFDLGHGEYLIANAEGKTVKIEFQKPGYAFDTEAATIPIFAGGMTQYYLRLQSGGAVYESGQAARVTSALITGYILRLSDSRPISGVTVAFVTGTGTTVRPSVVTDKLGFYKQTQIPVNRALKVIPAKSPWKFKPAVKIVVMGVNGTRVDFKGY
jgi:hypothetical protein